MALAERGVRLADKLWVREVRRRDEDGRQVSVLATDYRSDLQRVAVTGEKRRERTEVCK
jgi:hypothetical protein